MADNKLKRLVCRLLGHKYLTYDGDGISGEDQQCVRCGSTRWIAGWAYVGNTDQIPLSKIPPSNP